MDLGTSDTCDLDALLYADSHPEVFKLGVTVTESIAAIVSGLELALVFSLIASCDSSCFMWFYVSCHPALIWRLGISSRPGLARPGRATWPASG